MILEAVKIGTGIISAAGANTMIQPVVAKLIPEAAGTVTKVCCSVTGFGLVAAAGHIAGDAIAREVDSVVTMAQLGKLKITEILDKDKRSEKSEEEAS